MFILTEDNDLINSKHVVSIYIVERIEAFEIIMNCSAYDYFTALDDRFEIYGHYFTYRSFKTREEAEAALLEFGNILNKNEA